MRILLVMHFLAFHITVAISVPDTVCTRKRASETAQCAGRIGCFITSCEADGSFSEPQCSGSTGMKSNLSIAIC